MLRFIITLVCIFTPPLGWVVLAYLNRQWEKENHEQRS